MVLAVLVAPAQILAQDPDPALQLPGPGQDPGTATSADPAAPDPADSSAPGAAAPPVPAADPQPQAETTTGASSVSSRAGATVTVKDFDFTPASITVNTGDSVTWSNQGPAAHSATADDGSFDTGVYNAGSSRSHTFSAPGTIPYHCIPHPFMTGTVRVLASSSSSGGNSSKGGSTNSGSSASSGPSEAAAVASPGAAGSSTQLPSTGSDPLPLAVAGALLLCAGLLARRRAI